MDVTRYDKTACLQRAIELLAGGDEPSLRYACLELRFCIEAIVYDKVRLYASRLPSSVVEIWQPPQAMKALIQLEPHADREFELSVAPGESGVPVAEPRALGAHRFVSTTWLRKTYNQLGSLLHLGKADLETAGAVSIRESLDTVVLELQRVTASQIDSSIAEVVEFKCARCESRVVVNAQRLRDTREASCVDPRCEAQYLARPCDDGSYKFELIQPPVDCCSCGKAIFLEPIQIRIGSTFRCRWCGTNHIVTSATWDYGVTE